MNLPLVNSGAPVLQPDKNSSSAGAASGFGDLFKQAIAKVDGQMKEADALVEGLISGRHANIEETMIAMQKANISFRLLTQVQNKVIGAYQEIQRMQL